MMFIQLLLATDDGVVARNSYVLITCTMYIDRQDNRALVSVIYWVGFCTSAGRLITLDQCRSVCALPFQPFPPATTENSIPGVNPPATKLSTLSVQNWKKSPVQQAIYVIVLLFVESKGRNSGDPALLASNNTSQPVQRLNLKLFSQSK